MSLENNQLQFSSIVGSSVEEEVVIGLRDTNSFAELIRAREEQQRRIRVALEEQNRQLRARLNSDEVSQSNGEAASSVASVRRRCSTFSPTKQHTVPVEEFITFVTEMKYLISCAQQADLVAIHALQDRVELQSRDLSQRVTELEAQIISMQRRDDVRFTDGERFIGPKVPSSPDPAEETSLQYITKEVENVRLIAEEAISRVRHSDEAIEKQQAVVHLFEKELNALETKMVEVESVPTLFKREAIALDERYNDFTQSVRDELERHHQQHFLSSVLNDEMRGLGERVCGVEQALTSIKEQVSCKVNRALEDGVLNPILPLMEGKKEIEVTEDAECDLHMKMTEVEARTRFLVDSQNNRSMAVEELTARVQSIGEKVESLVEGRLNNLAAVDNDRLENMTKELEGATAFIDDFISNRVSSGKDALILDGIQLNDRLSQVEKHLQLLDDKLNHITDKFHKNPVVDVFHQNISNGISGAGVGTSIGNNDRADTAVCNEMQSQEEHSSHQLQEELEMAAADLRERSAARLDIPYKISPVLSPSGTMAGVMPPPPYPRAAFVTRVVIPSVQKQLSPAVFGPFKAPPIPVGHDSVERAINEIREHKRQKEDAVVKVISALRNIQQRFADLSAREQPITKHGNARRGGRANYPEHIQADVTNMLESMAGQKEAVHSKEKQLLDLRNTLWREIAQLEEDERELLRS